MFGEGPGCDRTLLYVFNIAFLYCMYLDRRERKLMGGVQNYLLNQGHGVVGIPNSCRIRFADEKEGKNNG